MRQTIKIGKYSIDKDLFLFLVISVLLGMVTAADSTSMANRLYDELHFTVMQRSALETPRELPGFLTVVLIGLLNGLGDIRIAGVANIIGGIGLLCFGLVPNQYYLVLIFLVVYSVGQHLYLPLSSTIAMSFATGESFGKSIGRVQSVNSFAIIAASGVLYLLYRFLNVSYRSVFVAAAICMILGGFLFLLMDNSKPVVSEKRFVFRKEYKTYYLLCTINGARKQITLTFVPWLIIDIYGQPVTTVTVLFFLVCILNVFFKPWFGMLVDKKGESFALRLEAVVMFAACLGFVFAKDSFPAVLAMGVTAVCYVIDKLMESANIARATYIRRLISDPAEVSRTLSMGQSMDHIISMFIPLVAGFAWYSGGPNGYKYVFIGGLVISLVNYFIAARLGPRPKPWEK